MSINTEMTALADAIRNKSGVTGKLSIAAMTTAIGNIVINPGDGDSDIVFGYLDENKMFQALDLSGDAPVKIGSPETIDQFTTYIVPDPGIEPFRLSLKNETDEASVHLILEQTGVGEGADYYEINATEYLNDSIFYRTQDNREWRLLEVDASDAKKSITINLSSNNTYVEFLNETSVWGGEKLWYTFEMQGDDVVASRNIMALIHNNDLYPYCFNGTFRNCTNLVSAPELPATELAQYCYRWMFEGCTSLTTAPKLPAESMALYCYAAMFQGCTSLVSAPKLPAESMALYCYAAMFQGCTSLVHPPEFPQYQYNTYKWTFCVHSFFIINFFDIF